LRDAFDGRAAFSLVPPDGVNVSSEAPGTSTSFRNVRVLRVL
jgi:hypothetical protein